jgi:hypothetical protein
MIHNSRYMIHVLIFRFGGEKMPDIIYILLAGVGAVLVLSLFDRTTGPVVRGWFQAVGLFLAKVILFIAGTIALVITAVWLYARNCKIRKGISKYGRHA